MTWQEPGAPTAGDPDDGHIPEYGDHDPLLPNRLRLVRARIDGWQARQEIDR